jgi:NTP pyrophosphatase (non-canonical NTP hydrolase)
MRAITTAERDTKPAISQLMKLVEETGEVAESVNVSMGFIHKDLKEPLMGEIADVILCAIAVAKKMHPLINNTELYKAIDGYLNVKMDKWEKAIDVAKEKDKKLKEIKRR